MSNDVGHKEPPKDDRPETAEQGASDPSQESSHPTGLSPQEMAERMYLPTMFGGHEYSPAEGGAEAFGGSDEAPEGPVDKALLDERVRTVLRDIYDPEIPVNIYDLGLIYGLEITDDADVDVEMTLTAPACPVAGSIVQEVAERVGGVEGVRRSRVRLVFDPPWSPDRMTEEAKLELGML